MSKTVSIDDMAEVISQELESYRKEVMDALKKDVKAVAKETVQTLKKTSPRRAKNSSKPKDKPQKPPQRYYKGWKSKVTVDSQDDIKLVIYNAKKPQLTHLLENGHAKVTGGRVEGIPHIRPATEQAEKELEGRVKVHV